VPRIMCRLLEMRRCWTTAASSASYGIPAKAWWNSPDDPNIRLLKETLLDAQYWDAPGATVAHVKMATAALTGAKPSMEREPKSRHKINDEGTNQASAGRARARFCWPRTLSESVNASPEWSAAKNFGEASWLPRTVVAEKELAVCRRQCSSFANRKFLARHPVSARIQHDDNVR
jgi:hypothetical protein